MTLHQLIAPSSRHSAIVVFIHGLNTGQLEDYHLRAWISEKPASDSSWPYWLKEVLLEERDTEIGVYSYSYNSAVVGETLDLHELSIAALEAISSAIGQYSTPIFFICHSFGGVLAKDLILRADQLSRRDEINSLLSRIRGVVFLGTPHTQNSTAKLAMLIDETVIPLMIGGVLSSIKQMTKHASASPLVRILANKARMKELAERYRSLVEKRNIQHKIFYETKSYHGKFIVDDSEADPHIANSLPIPCDRMNHFEIAAPNSRASDIIRIVASFIHSNQKGKVNRFRVGGHGSVLPIECETLFGRETIVETIWTSWSERQGNGLAILGPPGQGKTAVAQTFLMQQTDSNWRGIARAFVWSFGGQGTESDQQSSLSEFWTELAAEFECRIDQQSDGAIARAVLRQIEKLNDRALMVLDGLEVQQYPSDTVGKSPIKNEALRAFVKSLAQSGNCFLLITSQRGISDLRKISPAFQQVELPPLSSRDCRALLQSNGVANAELADHIAERNEGRPLGMILDAHTLHFEDSSLANKTYLEYNAEAQLTSTVARWIDNFQRERDSWMKGKHSIGTGALELACLYALSLFDQPVPREELQAAIGPRMVHGLEGDIVQGTGYPQYLSACLKRLEHDKITVRSGSKNHLFSLSPSIRGIVRQFFHADITQWRHTHERLSNYYIHTHAALKVDYQEGIEGVLVLFKAASHCFQSGGHSRAFNEIYLGKIQGPRRRLRGSVNAITSELEFFRNYFSRDWSNFRSELSLPDTDRASLCAYAHYVLRSVGELEASRNLVQLQRQLPGLTKSANQIEYRTDWIETLLIGGETVEAITESHNTLQLSAFDKAGVLARIRAHLFYGTSLIQQGDQSTLSEIHRHFEMAEQLQREDEQVPKLVGVQGYLYGRYRLSIGDFQGALDRAKYCKTIAAEFGLSILSRGLADCLMARAIHAAALDERLGSASLSAKADEALHFSNDALEHLVKTDQRHFLAEAYLVRAGLFRCLGNPQRALADLENAFHVVQSGGFRYYEIDWTLECIRYCLAFNLDEHIPAYAQQAKAAFSNCDAWSRAAQLSHLTSRENHSNTHIATCIDYPAIFSTC